MLARASDSQTVVLDARSQAEAVRQDLEQRPVHAFFLAAAHLVPIVAGQFKLGSGGEFHLGQSREVLEARLPGNLLGEKPLHLVHGRRLGQPREQRIALAGSRLYQVFEPGREPVRIGGRPGGPVPHQRAPAFEKLALDPQEFGHLLDVLPPILDGEGGRQPPSVEVGEAALEVVLGPRSEPMCGMRKIEHAFIPFW